MLIVNLLCYGYNRMRQGPVRGAPGLPEKGQASFSRFHSADVKKPYFTRPRNEVESSFFWVKCPDGRAGEQG
uniref:hypothetical protein n=1 Tax=Candidatus Electronema sp. TaxID=2698783 RepID=UPI004056200A